MHRPSDFDYALPPERIAQHPLADRAASRLLVLERASGAIRHTYFPSLLDLIAPQDVLVLNVSRVIPARLRGTREGGLSCEQMRSTLSKAHTLSTDIRRRALR